MTNTTTPFAEAFERRRRELDMRQRDFAEHVLGITQSAYTRLLHCGTTPSYHTIKRAWRHGGIDPLAVIGGAPPEGRVRFTIHAPDHVPEMPETCAIARMNIGSWEVRAELKPQRARQMAQELLKLADQKETMK